MKKLALFGIAAFYLLLSTGTFVCIVHCTGAHFLETQATRHDHAVCCRHARSTSRSKNTRENKSDNPCGSKHGSYVIKENIKPVIVHQHVVVPEIANKQFFAFIMPENNYLPIIQDGRYRPPTPSSSGKKTSILYRSLQI